MTEHDDKASKATHAEAHGDAQELGLAGRMSRAFIHSPLSPLLFFAMLAMGLLGLIFTPRQEDPQISVPMVDIFVQYPGASSGQVASLAIDPLERIMSEIPGVKHVYSASSHGEGMVTVQFKVGEQPGLSTASRLVRLAVCGIAVPSGRSTITLNSGLLSSGSIFTVTHLK